ncbi:MAG: nitrogenase cofactor biosynthesis protein NifB [Oxalobacter sp.]|nr:MAG: nitrogenase cofactor biosynthesis protein NifB [Oxalobacter sp.]
MQTHKTFILQPASPTPASGCAGGLRSSCASGGSDNAQENFSPEIWDKIKNHPCYNEGAHQHFARMHVAVAPACNIQCNYCNRKFDCSNESRPGVVSEKLTPEQAAKKVLAVASKIPQMSVVGIAGPGDALANGDKTFDTFEMIAAAAPHIKLCLSTNGLLLPEHVDRIQALNIEHVTITINMVDPEIGQHIYPWIFYKNRRWTGIEASRILHEQQMKGLEMLAARGVLCKVNSVMIPGINDEHLVEVNKAVKARGAFIHNIMPLISAPEHGTVFGLQGIPSPSAQALKNLQDQCEGNMKVMRHCRQCRADAVGMLGEDRNAEFTQEKVDTMEISYDASVHLDYLKRVEARRQGSAAQALSALSEITSGNEDISILVAVTSKGDGKISQHFGHAKEFQIFEASAKGAKFIGHRRVDLYCQGGYDNEEVLPNILRALNDCHAVLAAKIGACPQHELKASGIDPVDSLAFEYIEAGVLGYFKTYLAKIASGEIAHTPRGDAQIRQGAFVSAA